MKAKPPYYRIYLLTVWQEQNRDPPGAMPGAIVWRYRLEEPHSGRQLLFADARTLLSALQAFAAEPEENFDDRDEQENFP